MTEKPQANPEKWLNEYGDFLYRYTISRVNDPTLAQDIVQETFLSALKAYSSFDGKSSVRTWFVSILRHKIIDHYRKKSRNQKYFEDPGQSKGDESDFQENGFWKLDHAPADWGDQPEEILHQKEFMQILRNCISLLPERIAAVFSLRELEGIDSDSICKELDITSSNLWVMLHRGRAQLRRCLESNWFGVSDPQE